MELSEEGRRSVLFSLSDAALTSVDTAYQRSMMGRIRSVPRSDWIAFGSLVVSCGALGVAFL